MKQSTSMALLLSIFAGGLLSDSTEAGDGIAQDPPTAVSLVEAWPALAPFQYTRFCLRYPADCTSKAAEAERIDMTDKNFELLNRVNRSVNSAIAPAYKDYRANFWQRWTIAPATGDCNDYVVTKRHELLLGGLPAKALRLAVVETPSGAGHLVLLVATTSGDLVLDNLTGVIRAWQITNYRWLKIQSARDANYWYAVKALTTSPPLVDQKRRSVGQ
jgi:predicted transglutaminase-like cysteine proteinase